jgi:hypothetical protein
MHSLSIEDIQKDREAKAEVLRKLYRGFREEMREIEEEQQKILLDIIRARKKDE